MEQSQMWLGLKVDSKLSPAGWSPWLGAGLREKIAQEGVTRIRRQDKIELLGTHPVSGSVRGRHDTQLRQQGLPASSSLKCFSVKYWLPVLRKEGEAKKESRKSYGFFPPLASVSLMSWPFQGLLRATEVISFFFFHPLLFSASLGVEVLMSWNKLKGRRRGLWEVGGLWWSTQRGLCPQ